MTAGLVTSGDTIQTYARAAGALGLVSLVAGGFGEAYVPGALVVSGDAAATATHIVTSEALFRWGFTAYLVEALCDTGLSLLFYVLFAVVRKDLALLAVFFRLIGTAGFGMAQVFYFAALPLVGDNAPLKAFSPDQLHALAMVSLNVSAYGQVVFTMFFGVGSILLGYLMYRSDFLPKILGILVVLGGLGFAARTFTWALAPSYSSPLLLLPGGIAFLALTAWLLVKGVDTAKWTETAERAASR